MDSREEKLIAEFIDKLTPDQVSAGLQIVVGKQFFYKNVFEMSEQDITTSLYLYFEKKMSKELIEARVRQVVDQGIEAKFFTKADDGIVALTSFGIEVVMMALISEL